MKLNKIIKVLTIAVAFMLGNLIGNAQGLPCFPDAKGSYYTTPYFNYTPVLYTYMPYEIMISYIIADSIIANCSKNFMETHLKRMRINSDTLNYGLKHLYRMADYNPILYYSFLNTTQTSKLRPLQILGLLDKRLESEWTTSADITNKLISASYILRVYANNTQKINKTLPAGANNANILYIRWIMSSEISLNGLTVQAGGPSQINNIIIIGEPISSL